MIAYILLATGGPWTAFGLALIWTGLFAMLWVLIDWGGGVHMGPDPNIPEAPTRETDLCWRPHVDSSDVEVMFAPVIDISETVEIKPVVDPLAVTTEIERIEEDTPLYYTIRRPPPPPRLETHTQAWERDGLLARIREAAGEPAP